MTRHDEIARRNARLAKREIRDLAYPAPKADGPGYQKTRERAAAIRWHFPTESEE